MLHRRRYGDIHLLLELFTPEQGRVPVMARGAGAPGSRRRGLLQPFVPLLAAWRGRGEVATLSRVESAGPPFLLRGRRLYSALYLNELLMRLLPREEAAEVLFACYRDTLAALAGGDEEEHVLRRFELALLGHIGYAPDLTRDARGNSVAPKGRYRFEAGVGLVPSSEGVEGATLLALAGGHPIQGDDRRREARVLMRALLAPHLGDRPLKSRELFRTMRPVSHSSDSVES